MEGEKVTKNEPVITDIGTETGLEVMELESLCLQCEHQGVTRMALTRIPHFREVIVSSFSCDNCGNQNNELQPARRIQDKAVKYVVSVNTIRDLSRQVVCTNTASMSIPELEFEIPPNVGSLTTIEGVLDKAIEGLGQDQVLRKIQHPQLAESITTFIAKLTELKNGDSPFTLVVDDVSGNSFVENLLAPAADPHTHVTHYTRTKLQDETLGIYEEEQEQEEPPDLSLRGEVLHIDSNCPECNAPCPVNMKLVDIPHFKQVVIMAVTCDACGYRNNEVKGGAGISPLARRISLCITSVDDLKRDLLKSDTCAINIPELDFETQAGTLGGKFTTVEGLLVDIRDSVKRLNPFVLGDSSETDQRVKIDEFCAKINDMVEGTTLGSHLVLDDPAGNSYLQNPFTPENDPQMEIVDYERTFDQNEDLGLNDMNTENYETT